MKKCKNLVLVILLFLLSLCLTTGACLTLRVFAADDAVSASDWTRLAGWRDTTAVVDYEDKATNTKGVNIYQASGTDFSVSYTKNPFYLDGFEFRFYANYKNGTKGASNLKIVMTRDGHAWWNDDKAAFSVDFKYESATSCTVTMNTKNPNGHSDYATSPGAIDPAFYWDNSKENVFRLYFHNDGVLYMSINGTELNCGKSGLDTARLRDWGIFDQFINGRAYLQLWGQQLNAPLWLDIRQAPAQMQEPAFTAFTGDGEWTVEEGSVTSLVDGVRNRAFKTGADGATIASTKNVSLKNSVVNMNLALAENKEVGFYFNGIGGKQVRISLSNTKTNNLKVATYNGQETVLYQGTHSFKLMDLSSPDYIDSVKVQFKKVGKTFKLLLNGEFVNCDLSALTAFVAENFDNGASTLKIHMNGEGIVKTIGLTEFNEASSVGGKFTNKADSHATFVRDDNYDLIYAERDNGVFKVMDQNSKLWVDGFGVRFRLDKLTDNDSSEFCLILSSTKTWYSDSSSKAVILSFKKATGGTDVALRAYDGSKETTVATGKTDAFSMNYAVENFVNFGYTNYGWTIIVGTNEVDLTGDCEEALNGIKQSFDANIAYLQIENKGGENTVVSVGEYTNMVKSYIPPRGWTQGHYLVGPQWGESSPDTEAVFGYPGEGYTAEKSVKVPFADFKMEFALAPGNSLTQLSIAFSDGSTDWYNTCWSFGVMFTYNPNSDMLENGQIEFGLLYANPDENMESERVDNKTVNFNWYQKNTLEVKSFRGEYVLTLNGESVFDNFDTLVKKIAPAYIAKNSVAELQFFVTGDTTLRIYNTTEAKMIDPPSIQRTEVDRYNNAEYETGKEISIDLSKLFKSESGNALVYTADMGTVEGSIWKYAPDKAGTVTVKFTAADGDQTSLPVSITLNVTEGKSGGCGSQIGIGALWAGGAVLLIAGLAIVWRRKHEN